MNHLKKTNPRLRTCPVCNNIKFKLLNSNKKFTLQNLATKYLNYFECNKCKNYLVELKP